MDNWLQLLRTAIGEVLSESWVTSNVTTRLGFAWVITRMFSSRQSRLLLISSDSLMRP